MAKFIKGDIVNYRNAANYVRKGNYNQTCERGSFFGEAIKSMPNGVYVKTESGRKEFVHVNRITN
tara:strand:+ start:266 stop:460 length:195 start_codon:yes stop_codon:yes gene_type:complete